MSLQIVSARKGVEAQYIEMKVPQYSYGCGNKIKKALARFKGNYFVKVGSICNKDEILAAVKTKGKVAHFLGAHSRPILTIDGPGLSSFNQRLSTNQQIMTCLRKKMVVGHC
ncbi:hypothetical protein AMTRI_Chr09g17030 [Amborella trichopoda]